MEFNAEAIVLIVTAALSLALEIIPGFTDLWEGVAKKYKPLVVFVACLLIPLIIIGVSCLGVDLGFGAVCPNPADSQMWVNGVLLGLMAFAASQGTYAVGKTLSERLKE